MFIAVLAASKCYMRKKCMHGKKITIINIKIIIYLIVIFLFLCADFHWQLWHARKDGRLLGDAAWRFPV